MIESKVVIVAGSGRGIGRSVAITYAGKGAKVILAERDNLAGRETEKTIISAGGESCLY